MKNKFIIVSLMLVMIFSLTACAKEEVEVMDAIKFKEEYESLNGEVNDKGKNYRVVSIDEDNPFVYVTAEALIEKMDNDDTFYVYFGSRFCPWCRSVIEKAIEMASKEGINEVYYVDIWDDEGNEVLRDKYVINSQNELEMSIKGTDEYYEILGRFDNVLSDYTLEDNDGNEINVGEKRIYAPSFVFINNGEAEVLVEGVSDKQKSSNNKLTDEILEDEEEIFSDFFDIKSSCDDGKC